jgi:7-keto-8-aminopelargonate synthetase-like enzyme
MVFKPTDSQQMLLEISRFGKSRGVTRANTTGEVFLGRAVEINGRPLTSYASCSYLGFDLDERIMNGSIEAIKKYGTMFPTSRSYLQMGLYEELEARFEKIFNAPCIVGASTTLSHLAVLPSLVTKDDAIIIDRQGHNSLQDAVTAQVGRGAYREIVPHNDMVELRSRIEKLSTVYNKVWYVADGVYSIYGDVAPFKEIRALLDEFPNLIVYVDDAHGMGWAGKHGCGLAIEQIGHHERLIVVTSLGKACATGGGVMVLPDEETKELVRITGKTLIFSSPLTPGQLGAALAMTEILLSDEINSVQEKLQERCDLFLEEASHEGLTIIDDSATPIFYVSIGDLEVLAEVTSGLQFNHNIFVTPTGFPAVAKHESGLRITITTLHTPEQIKALVAAIGKEIDSALSRRGLDRKTYLEQKLEEAKAANKKLQFH